MKTWVYFQLNNLEDDLYYPQEVLGWFKIANDVVPIVFDFTGTFLFEFQFEGKLDIINADKQFYQATSNKKVPSNVICYCKEFPSGGWDN